MGVASAGKTAGDVRAARTSPVGGVIALTVVTLTAYFYFYLYRSLTRFEEDASSEAVRVEVRRTRRFVTAGLLLQFVAVMVLLAGVVPILTDPSSQEEIWKAFEQGRIEVPAGLARANAWSQLLTWIGWIALWAPVFAFLAGALRAEGEPIGSAGFGGVLVGFRVAVGVGGLVGLGGLASAVSYLDAIFYLVLVGCCVSAANDVWVARARS